MLKYSRNGGREGEIKEHDGGDEFEYDIFGTF
jgi:hypothetical protein